MGSYALVGICEGVWELLGIYIQRVFLLQKKVGVPELKKMCRKKFLKEQEFYLAFSSS